MVQLHPLVEAVRATADVGAAHPALKAEAVALLAPAVFARAPHNVELLGLPLHPLDFAFEFVLVANNDVVHHHLLEVAELLSIETVYAFAPGATISLRRETFAVQLQALGTFAITTSYILGGNFATALRRFEAF